MKNKNKFKFKSFLLTKNHVLGMIKAMENAGLTVEKDFYAGTVIAKFKKTEVYRAIEKGRDQPWIVRHIVDLFHVEQS